MILRDRPHSQGLLLGAVLVGATCLSLPLAVDAVRGATDASSTDVDAPSAVVDDATAAAKLVVVVDDPALKINAPD